MRGARRRQHLQHRQPQQRRQRRSPAGCYQGRFGRRSRQPHLSSSPPMLSLGVTGTWRHLALHRQEQVLLAPVVSARSLVSGARIRWLERRHPRRPPPTPSRSFARTASRRLPSQQEPRWEERGALVPASGVGAGQATRWERQPHAHQLRLLLDIADGHRSGTGRAAPPRATRLG